MWLKSKTDFSKFHSDIWRRISGIDKKWASVRVMARGRQTTTYISHYGDVIMGTMASQLTSLTIVYRTVYSGPDQRKYQSSASLAFVRRIHRWPVNSPLKGPVMWKMFSFDDVIMKPIRAWHIPLPDSLGQVKLTFGQVDFDKVSSEWYIICIEESKILEVKQASEIFGHVKPCQCWPCSMYDTICCQ